MPRSEFAAYVVDDLLGHMPGISSRAMFGGYGVYKDSVIFALIADDQLYFKVDEINQPRFEAYGSQPFVYEGKGKPITMSYWLLPEEIMEDGDQLAEWVEASIEASTRSRK